MASIPFAIVRERDAYIDWAAMTAWKGVLREVDTIKSTMNHQYTHHYVTGDEELAARCHYSAERWLSNLRGSRTALKLVCPKCTVRFLTMTSMSWWKSHHKGELSHWPSARARAQVWTSIRWPISRTSDVINRHARLDSEPTSRSLHI